MSPAQRSTYVVLGDEVVAESVSAVEERFLHNLLKISFSNDFVTDFSVSDIVNRFSVARANKRSDVFSNRRFCVLRSNCFNIFEFVEEVV